MHLRPAVVPALAGERCLQVHAFQVQLPLQEPPGPDGAGVLHGPPGLSARPSSLRFHRSRRLHSHPIHDLDLLALPLPVAPPPAAVRSLPRTRRPEETPSSNRTLRLRRLRVVRRQRPAFRPSTPPSGAGGEAGAEAVRPREGLHPGQQHRGQHRGVRGEEQEDHDDLLGQLRAQPVVSVRAGAVHALRHGL